MKCPYPGCGGEIDLASFEYDAKVGRRGICPKCGRGVTITRQARTRKRLTNSQKRKIKRERRKDHV